MSFQDITFDHVTFILIICGFVPFFTWRAIRAFNRKRYSKFTWCIVLNLFMVRLSYLRVATQGGKVGFGDPAALQFSKELGDPLVFFIATLLLLIFAVIRVLDDDHFTKTQYVKREDYDMLVAQLASLKKEASDITNRLG
jgi:hypothetical protein